MKKRYRAFIGVALGITCLIGCARKPKDSNQVFSPVYKEFDAAVLMESGSKSPDGIQSRGSWNTKTQRGSRQMRGLLPAGSDTNSIAMILSRVDAFVMARTGSLHTEGELAKDVRPDQKHIYGMWMYNCHGRHGELHLWLFPNATEREVAFAAYLFEENLE